VHAVEACGLPSTLAVRCELPISYPLLSPGATAGNRVIVLSCVAATAGTFGRGRSIDDVLLAQASALAIHQPEAIAAEAASLRIGRRPVRG
jgi:hypothetical protein